MTKSNPLDAFRSRATSSEKGSRDRSSKDPTVGNLPYPYIIVSKRPHHSLASCVQSPLPLGGRFICIKPPKYWFIKMDPTISFGQDILRRFAVVVTCTEKFVGVLAIVRGLKAQFL